MAGNTRLIGFVPGGNSVILKRWGKDVMVKVSPESVQAMLKACTDELPQKPLPYQVGRFKLCATYDSHYGQGVIRMSADVLDSFLKFLHQTLADAGEDFIEYHRELLIEVEEVLDEHREYTSTDEPGL